MAAMKGYYFTVPGGSSKFFRWVASGTDDYVHVTVEAPYTDADVYGSKTDNDVPSDDGAGWAAAHDPNDYGYTEYIYGIANTGTLYIEVNCYENVGDTCYVAIFVHTSDYDTPYIDVPTATCNAIASDFPWTTVECPTNCMSQPVYGTRWYSYDSSLCASALHTGVINGEAAYQQFAMSGFAMPYDDVDSDTPGSQSFVSGGYYQNGIMSEDVTIDFFTATVSFTVGVDAPAAVDPLPGPETGPNIYSGYGRVLTGNVLKITGQTQMSYFDILSDRNDDNVDDSDFDKFCVSYNSAEYLKFTLVWTDPAASTLSYYQLVNDLDLYVTAENCADPADNVGAANAWLGNMGDDYDMTNNVEQVYLENVPQCNYCANVRGTNVPQGPQRYALVANAGAAFTQVADADPFDMSGISCVGNGPVDVVPTCNDLIWNGDEDGVDCGGSCSDCPEPNCDDGIWNGDELDIDCGPGCPYLCGSSSTGVDEDGDDDGDEKANGAAHVAAGAVAAAAVAGAVLFAECT